MYWQSLLKMDYRSNFKFYSYKLQLKRMSYLITQLQNGSLIPEEIA